MKSSLVQFLFYKILLNSEMWLFTENNEVSFYVLWLAFSVLDMYFVD